MGFNAINRGSAKLSDQTDVTQTNVIIEFTPYAGSQKTVNQMVKLQAIFQIKLAYTSCNIFYLTKNKKIKYYDG